MRLLYAIGLAVLLAVAFNAVAKATMITPASIKTQLK